MNINYAEKGNGKPLILLHGWGASLSTFNNVIEEFCEEFRVYAVDLPGFGESDVLLPLNVYEVCDVLREFVLKLNIINPIILGHSYGGRIAIIYASRYDVSRLVLVSAAGVKQKLRFNKRFKIRVYKALKKCHIPIRMGSKDYLNADNVKRIMLVNAVNTDLSSELRNIKCPTLLIYGDKDEVTPVELGNKIKSLITGSYLIVMEECDHFPYLRRCNYFCLIVMSFLVGEDVV